MAGWENNPGNLLSKPKLSYFLKLALIARQFLLELLTKKDIS